RLRSPGKKARAIAQAWRPVTHANTPARVCNFLHRARVCTLEPCKSLHSMGWRLRLNGAPSPGTLGNPNEIRSLRRDGRAGARLRQRRHACCKGLRHEQGEANQSRELAQRSVAARVLREETVSVRILLAWLPHHHI